MLWACGKGEVVFLMEIACFGYMSSKFILLIPHYSKTIWAPAMVVTKTINAVSSVKRLIQIMTHILDLTKYKYQLSQQISYSTFHLQPLPRFNLIQITIQNACFCCYRFSPLLLNGPALVRCRILQRHS